MLITKKGEQQLLLLSVLIKKSRDAFVFSIWSLLCFPPLPSSSSSSHSASYLLCFLLPRQRGGCLDPSVTTGQEGSAGKVKRGETVVEFVDGFR